MEDIIVFEDLMTWLKDKINEETKVYLIFSELDGVDIRYEKGKLDAYIEIYNKILKLDE